MPKKTQYIVRDPQGVYEDQVVEVASDFEITDAAIRATQTDMLIEAFIVKAIAIERMYGCPISGVDEKHVRDMLGSVQMELAPPVERQDLPDNGDET